MQTDVGLDPVAVEEEDARPGSEGTCREVDGREVGDRLGREDETARREHAVGQGRRFGRAGLDDSRRFERGKRRQLAHQGPAATRGRPEHDVVELAPGRRLVDEEPSDPDADPHDGGHRRLGASPAGSLRDGRLPSTQCPGIGWPSGAVAGAGEIEAENRIPVRGQVRSPVAHGTVCSDLLPAERRREQDRRMPARLLRWPVDDEESPGRLAEVDDLLVHDSGTASGASRLSARTDNPAAAFAAGAAALGRSVISRGRPGSTQKASSSGTNPERPSRTP